MTTTASLRKTTRIIACDTHLSTFGVKARASYRDAEIVCEGGPGWGGSCSPAPCEVRPGTDYFRADAKALAEVAAMPANWAVNRKR